MNPELTHLVKKLAIDAGIREGRPLDATLELFETYAKTQASADTGESLRYHKDGTFVHKSPFNVFLKPKDLVFEAARIYGDVKGIQSATPPMQVVLIFKILFDIVAAGDKLQTNIIAEHEAQVLWAVYCLTIEKLGLSTFNLVSLLTGKLSQDEINQAIENLSRMRILTYNDKSWEMENDLVLTDYFVN